MKLNGQIYVAPGDSIPETLRALLDLADSPAEVQMEVGTRTVLVSDRLLDRWVAAREERPAEAEAESEERPAEAEAGAEAGEQPAEAEETTAPRQRRPRKAAAPAAEENA